MPQGSVLAPVLFNSYVSDYGQGEGMQYSYADDTALGFDNHSFEAIETSLEKDLKMLAEFFNNYTGC